MKSKPAVLAGLCGALVLCAAALDEGDSLISLRYLNDTFIPETVQQAASIQEQRLQTAYDQALQRAGQIAAGGTGAGSYSASLAPRTLAQGSAVTLETGGCFLLVSGAGTVRHTGAVVDVTTGTETASGGALAAGHRYLVAEGTWAEFSLTAPSSAGFTGSYRLEQGGGTPSSGGLPFTDVRESDWFYSSVSYVYQNGLFAGMDGTSFGPNYPMDRSMLVTVLYKLAGSPEDELASASASFSDVRDKDWFAPYVRWAASFGVTAGTGEGRFSPAQPVTRQQVMVLLYNFGARYMGLNLYQRTDLSGYTDLSRVDGWGLEAMQWAVGAGILSSTTPGELVLEPQSPATRAQVAVMLQNFAEKFL